MLGSIEYLDNNLDNIHQRSSELSTGCLFSISVIEGQECSLKKYNPLTSNYE